MRRLAVFALVLTTACTSATTQVGRAVNTYTSKLDAYKKACTALPLSLTVSRCQEFYDLLTKTKKDIQSADAAVKLGGKGSPQQKQLEADIKLLETF